MKHRMVGIGVCIAAVCILATACDTGSGGASPGTFDVTLVGIDPDVVALGSAEYGIYLYPVDTKDIYDPANCLAMNTTIIAAEEETLRFKVTDGNFNPTAEDWLGDPGWAKYDLYLLIDLNGTGDLEQGIGERTNNYPGTIYINGATAIRLDYFSDLIEY